MRFELAELCAEIDVLEPEYRRLLGYPRGAELSERALELAAWARDWYRAHGKPWIYARAANRLQMADSSIRLEGEPFRARRLRALFQRAEGCGAILAAVSASGALETEAERLWREGKPDEYFFLEVFGSAVVERLVTMAGARLCAWADSRGMAVLPHDSPGYPGWDISEQPRLAGLLAQGGGQNLPGGLEALASGALRPKKSQVAVFGLTNHTQRVRRLTELSPCETCSYMPCQFRRAPYERGAGCKPMETARLAASPAERTRAAR